MIFTRKANESDIQEISLILKEMHKEGIYSKINPSEYKIKNFLLNKIRDKNSLVLILISDNKIIGLFIAEIQEYFFSTEKISMDIIFFILKSKRKAFGAIKLLQNYFNWAESYNVKEICLSTTNGVEVEKIEKMYRKLGFNRVGIMYKKGF